MANTSFEHAGEARAALRAIVADPAYGPRALSSAQTMSNLLRVFLPDAPKETFLLVAAAEAGLADLLREHVSQGVGPGTAIRLAASSLAACTAFTLDACFWVAAELAIALGLVTGDSVTTAVTDSGSASAAPTQAAGAAVPGAAPTVPPAPGYPGAPPGAAPAVPPGPGYPMGSGSTDMPAQFGQQRHAGAWRRSGGAATGRSRAYRRRSQVKQPDDAVSRAVRAAVRPGLLAFNPPAEMIQGRKERVEVGIARSPELESALAAGLRGRGELQFVGVATSSFMGVELKGASFEICPYSPFEQLVAPTARWEFDVRPYRAGLQTLTLCVCLRVDPVNPAMTTGGRIAVPVLEREIRIRVDVAYGSRRFLVNNWQWLIATAVALGGALAAWVTLFH